MTELDRRRFLVAVAATVAVSGVSWHSAGGPKQAVARADVLGSAPSPITPALPRLLPPPGPDSRVALPGGAALKQLPGNGDLLAWTVDDGVDSDVVRLYTQFAKDTGVRLTYFVTGAYRSWTDNSALLRPLVESGQIQLANHTWTHPDLTRLSPNQIAEELKAPTHCCGIPTGWTPRRISGRHTATTTPWSTRSLPISATTYPRCGAATYETPPCFPKTKSSRWPISPSPRRTS